MILLYLLGSFSPLLLIALFVAFIISISKNHSLSRRVDALEAKMKGGMPTPAIPFVSAVKAAPAAIAVPGVIFKDAADYGQANQIKLGEINKALDSTPIMPNRFAAWMKEDWLMKIGALLFIVGFGWFVSYAFLNNWVGPVGRISIGIVGGSLVMLFGFWWMKKYPVQGAFFTALGAGMTMLTIFAARSIYGFFTPELAVAFDFLIVAFVSFASYKYNIKSLAFIAQILAFVTPLLAAGQTDSVFLFAYLLFISLATLFLAAVTGWRDLIVSSLIFVGLYSLPYISAGASMYGSGIYHRDAPIILNFSYLFSALYLIAGMVAVIKKGVENAKNEILLAVLNGLFLFMWIYNIADKDIKVLIFAFWALVFSIASFVAFKFSSKLAPFYAYGSVAVAFIAAATAAQLHGADLTIAFTMEVLLLVVTVLMLTKNIPAAIKTAWLFIVPAALSLQSIGAYLTSKDMFSKDFFVLVLLAASLIIIGRLITTAIGAEVNVANKKEVNAGSALIIFGTIYVGFLIWQMIHIALAPAEDIATMASLIVFTVCGLIAYFAGLYGNDMARRVYGIVLLSFVVIRLILVDVWQMELFGRVITFLAIGVLLMSTAFITKKKKHE